MGPPSVTDTPTAWTLPSSLTVSNPAGFAPLTQQPSERHPCQNAGTSAIGTSAISQPCDRSGRHYGQALHADLVGLAYGQTRLELRVSRGYETWRPLRCLPGDTPRWERSSEGSRGGFSGERTDQAVPDTSSVRAALNQLSQQHPHPTRSRRGTGSHS